MTKHKVFAITGGYCIFERIVEERPNYGDERTYHKYIAGCFTSIEKTEEHMEEYPHLYNGDDRYFLIVRIEREVRT